MARSTRSTTRSTGFVPPSADARAEALDRARRLAAGLFPHQVEGLAFLLGRRRAILADDMGLGKTRQSIVAIAESAPDGPWLVVAPASVKHNWAREIGMARPGDAVHVVGPADPPASGTGWVVVNYDILARHADALGELPWGGIVFDEAHYLKNHTSQRSRLCRALVDGTPDAVVHCLTGTPLTNRPRDLFPLLQLVNHPMGRSFLSFARRYCDATHNGFGWVTDGASNLGELRTQLHGIMLRRTKDEVLDLPPKLRSWLPVPVASGVAKREMRKVLEHLLIARGERRDDRTQLLALITKARLQLSKAKVGATIDLVDGMLAQGEKAIVFASFDASAESIARHFGDEAVLLTGKTPAKARQALVDRFQRDDGPRVFVANLIAGGVGITLTAARQVVFHDLDWVPANHWQAEDRAYRIGQTGTVSVSYLVAEGTIDEFVRSALGVKSALIASVVDGTGDAGDAGTAGGDLLTELERLVGQLSPNIATLGDDESGEDPVDRLLREVTQAVARREGGGVGDAARDALLREGARTLPAEAVEALARVLAGPVSTRYRALSSSKPGAFYELEVVGGDVTCGCSGFEYRGACRHARALKAALVDGGALPEGIVAA